MQHGPVKPLGLAVAIPVPRAVPAPGPALVERHRGRHPRRADGVSSMPGSGWVPLDFLPATDRQAAPDAGAAVLGREGPNAVHERIVRHDAMGA